MNSRLRRWLAAPTAILLIFSAALFGVDGSAGRELQSANSPAQLTMLVDNYSQASPQTIARAEEEAGEILKHSGILLTWQTCQTPTHPESQPICMKQIKVGEILVRVLGRGTRTGIGNAVFGFAIGPTIASVYYDSALGLARQDGADYEAPVVLGALIAHEVGHLLLGSGHTDEGVMLPQWQREQIWQIMTGSLHFTQAQSKLLQAAAHKRINHGASVTRSPSISRSREQTSMGRSVLSLIGVDGPN